jgi:dTDP-4-dehydrorhamnose 3,5-epimerase
MKFRELILKGSWLIEPKRLEDERGFFARISCEREFADRGLNSRIAQCSISFNTHQGTLRGMHYQAPPHGETKLVRCTAGGIYDVIVDLRRNSSTYKKWAAVELTADNRLMLYIPEGFAHGFQTLRDGTEVMYQISVLFHPESARGVRWDDPAFGIQWPPAKRVLSDRDRCYPDFSE